MHATFLKEHTGRFRGCGSGYGSGTLPLGAGGGQAEVARPPVLEHLLCEGSGAEAARTVLEHRAAFPRKPPWGRLLGRRLFPAWRSGDGFALVLRGCLRQGPAAKRPQEQPEASEAPTDPCAFCVSQRRPWPSSRPPFTPPYFTNGPRNRPSPPSRRKDLSCADCAWLQRESTFTHGRERHVHSDKCVSTAAHTAGQRNDGASPLLGDRSLGGGRERLCGLPVL